MSTFELKNLSRAATSIAAATDDARGQLATLRDMTLGLLDASAADRGELIAEILTAIDQIQDRLQFRR